MSGARPPTWGLQREGGPHCSQRRPKMKTALLLLVILAAATAPARALRCHVCSSATDCKKPQDCAASSRFCRTMTKKEPLSGNLVEKDCVDWCTPSQGQLSQVSGGSATTACCASDLCNAQSSGAAAHAPLASTALGLTLALGLLALILAPGL
ncbi:lymphocyte antigen 6D isoform X1 [Rousettus aegyptiacus]|nr:lymphocyte antigen 6D isoform X1 [Rousettus aegyptiacus]